MLGRTIFHLAQLVCLVSCADVAARSKATKAEGQVEQQLEGRVLPSSSHNFLPPLVRPKSRVLTERELEAEDEEELERYLAERGMLPPLVPPKHRAQTERQLEETDDQTYDQSEYGRPMTSQIKRNMNMLRMGRSLGFLRMGRSRNDEEYDRQARSMSLLRMGKREDGEMEREARSMSLLRMGKRGDEEESSRSRGFEGQYERPARSMSLLRMGKRADAVEE